MLETWLLPITLFWGIAALYFGGFEHDIAGGTGFRQFIGVIITYVIFLVVWGVVHQFVMPDSAPGMIIASIVAAAAFPLEVRLGFLPVGGHVRRAEAH